MTYIRKVCSIMLILALTASTFTILQTTSAEAAKPAVPEFTVRYVDRSYDRPATYSTNPYTGKNELTQEANHIQDKRLELTIKNPAFTPYVDEENHPVNLYYSIRVRGHYDGSWFYADNGYYGPDIHYVAANLDSESTTFLYGLVGNNGTDLRCFDIPEGGQADFQVQAFIGDNTRISDGMTMLGEVYHYVFTGESSEWSSIQTVTIGETNSSPTPSAPTPQLTGTPTVSASPSQTPNPTANPQDPQTNAQIDFDWEKAAFAALTIAVVMLTVAVIGLWRRLPKKVT